MTPPTAPDDRTDRTDRQLLLEILDRLDLRETGAPPPRGPSTAGGGSALDRLDPDPRSLVHFHLVMMCVWLALILPTVVWWKESILWVAFMSLYANFVGHFSGWDAARAESAAG